MFKELNLVSKLHNQFNFLKPLVFYAVLKMSNKLKTVFAHFRLITTFQPVRLEEVNNRTRFLLLSLFKKYTVFNRSE